MKKVNQVLETNDYALFNVLMGNRVVNKMHVNRLKQSMQVNYLMSPILVNDKHERLLMGNIAT